jgi:ABC-type branched-subunit amino acid transport system ATPase component
MDALVELNGVRKSFNGAPALRSTHLQLKRGLTTALIGPSEKIRKALA